VNGGSRLLPLLLAALFLTALAGALASLSGSQAYLPRLCLLGAAVTFAVLLYRGRREIAFLLLRARRVSEPGPAGTWLLAAAVLFAAAIVFEQRPLRMDATGRLLNKLTPMSEAVLGQGEAPIELIGIYRETSPQRARAVDLLEIYRVASRRVSVRMVDPDRRPDEMRSLGINRASLVVVRIGAVQEEADELTEQSISETIVRAQNPRRSRVVFVGGHGERSIADGGAAGIGKLASVLRQSGYEPMEVRLFEEAIPPDAAMLAVVGASRRFLPGELAKIGEFLDGGGRALVCLEPGAMTGIEEMLRSRGVVLDSLEVYDESPATRGLGFGPRVVVAADHGAHPITPAGIGYCVFPGVRSVGLGDEPTWGVNAKVLLRTGEGARRITPAIGGSEEPIGSSAALPLGVVQEWEVPAPATGEASGAAAEKPYARLMAIGDSDWLSGQFLDLFSNRDLALRSFHWLARREFLLKIPPIDMRGTPLRVSLRGLRTLFYLLQIAVPFSLLALGLWVWSRRR